MRPGIVVVVAVAPPSPAREQLLEVVALAHGGREGRLVADQLQLVRPAPPPLRQASIARALAGSATAAS